MRRIVKVVVALGAMYCVSFLVGTLYYVYGLQATLASAFIIGAGIALIFLTLKKTRAPSAKEFPRAYVGADVARSTLSAANRSQAPVVLSFRMREAMGHAAFEEPQGRTATGEERLDPDPRLNPLVRKAAGESR
jgi:hypothetical protein